MAVYRDSRTLQLLVARDACPSLKLPPARPKIVSRTLEQQIGVRSLHNARYLLTFWGFLVALGLYQLHSVEVAQLMAAARHEPADPLLSLLGGGFVVITVGLSQLALHWRHIRFVPPAVSLRQPSRQLLIAGYLCITVGSMMPAFYAHDTVGKVAIGVGVALLVGAIILDRFGK